MNISEPSVSPPVDLKAQLQSAGSVVIYGAGSIGRDALTVLQHAGISVWCVLDAKDLLIDHLEGIPVLKPGDPSFTSEEKNQTTVIITIFNAYVHMPTIHANLAAQGWASVVIFTEFHEAFAAELGDRYWLTSRDFYRHLDGPIARTRELWDDQKSVTVFDQIIEFRLSGCYDSLEAPDLESQYFPSDLPSWPSPLRLIDCGAFDGDTLRQVTGLNLPLEAYAAFEPDPSNFAILATEIEATNLQKSVSMAAAWPCGAWSHSCKLRFSSGNASGSAIDQLGDTEIQCIALDEALPRFGANLIKMDIEGAEYPALLGATRMIHEHRPGLAICLYHEPAHLWQIPLLISSWNLDYRFYLRCHCFNGFDLVLYALPA